MKTLLLSTMALAVLSAGVIDLGPVGYGTEDEFANLIRFRELLWANWETGTEITLRYERRDHHTGELVRAEFEIEVDAFGVRRLVFRYDPDDEGVFRGKMFFDEVVRKRDAPVFWWKRKNQIPEGEVVPGTEFVIILVMGGEFRFSM